MNYYSITPMEKFAGITTDITIKNHHTWGCPVYVFNAGSKGNIDGLTKWKPWLSAGIYHGHSSFNDGSVALVLKPATGHVFPKLYVVVDDEF